MTRENTKNAPKNENRKGPKKKKSKILWVLGIVTILILGSILLFYYYKSLQKVPIIHVSVEMDGTIDKPQVLSLGFEEGTASYTNRPRGDSASMPGVFVGIFGRYGENLYYNQFSKWSSLAFRGKGYHNFTLGFDVEPKKGDFLKIQVKVVDWDGTLMKYNEFYFKWGFEPMLKTKILVEELNGSVSIPNANPAGVWRDPDSRADNPSGDIPAVYLEVARDGKQVNEFSYEPYIGPGYYNFTTGFDTEPRFKQTFNLRIIIKDEDGTVLTEYPQSGYWNYTW